MATTNQRPEGADLKDLFRFLIKQGQEISRHLKDGEWDGEWDDIPHAYLSMMYSTVDQITVELDDSDCLPDGVTLRKDGFTYKAL